MRTTFALAAFVAAAFAQSETVSSSSHAVDQSTKLTIAQSSVDPFPQTSYLAQTNSLGVVTGQPAAATSIPDQPAADTSIPTQPAAVTSQPPVDTDVGLLLPFLPSPLAASTPSPLPTVTPPRPTFSAPTTPPPSSSTSPLLARLLLPTALAPPVRVRLPLAPVAPRAPALRLALVPRTLLVPRPTSRLPLAPWSVSVPSLPLSCKRVAASSF